MNATILSPERWVAGMMSGTSLDGIDVALIRSDGERVLETGPAATFPYERAFRDRLRKQLGGRKFRRQQPVGPFVLDFYCPDEGLAVEVDGSIHDDPEQAVLDSERQSLLESLGIRFVRLPNDLVLNDPRAALIRITEAFQRVEA